MRLHGARPNGWPLTLTPAAPRVRACLRAARAAYRMQGDASMVLSLERIRYHEDKNLLAGHVIVLLGKDQNQVNWTRNRVAAVRRARCCSGVYAGPRACARAVWRAVRAQLGALHPHTDAPVSAARAP